MFEKDYSDYISTPKIIIDIDNQQASYLEETGGNFSYQFTAPAIITPKHIRFKRIIEYKWGNYYSLFTLNRADLSLVKIFNDAENVGIKTISKANCKPKNSTQDAQDTPV